MIFDLAESREALPAITEWQIAHYYDKEDVEWLDNDTIALHGINEGRRFRVVRGQRGEPVTVIPRRVPMSYEWHQLTNFRHIRELKEADGSLYYQWLKKGKIPPWVANQI